MLAYVQQFKWINIISRIHIVDCNPYTRHCIIFHFICGSSILVCNSGQNGEMILKYTTFTPRQSIEALKFQTKLNVSTMPWMTIKYCKFSHIKMLTMNQFLYAFTLVYLNCMLSSLHMTLPLFWICFQAQHRWDFSDTTAWIDLKFCI